MPNECSVCGKSVTDEHNNPTVYSFGEGWIFCTQECMKTFMECPKNAVEWMDRRSETLKRLRWIEFVPEAVRPRCHACNGLLTLCGSDDLPESLSWRCGYCKN